VSTVGAEGIVGQGGCAAKKDVEDSIMGSVTSSELCVLFVGAMRETLLEGMRKIEHCVGQLDDEQVWWRPRGEMNSIANLMLHLSGNLRQWIISGVGGAKDVRNRPVEFSDRSGRAKGEVLAILQKTVAEADGVLAKVTAEELVSKRRIQGFDETGMSAIVRAIPHFRGHVQEIIHMTREQVGEKYRFDFVPKGKEQESA
jgi:hypothetical protein